RHLATGQEARLPATAGAELRGGELPGVAGLGQQVDPRGDRGGDAEMGLHRVDARRQVDPLERAAIRQDPEERARKILDRAAARAVDHAVPADAQVPELVALE